MGKLLRWVLSRESIPVIAGGAVTMVTFCLSDAAIPNDDGSLWWVHWAMALASLVSYIAGALLTAFSMWPTIGKERDKASALDKALEVERERVSRFEGSTKTEQTLREADRLMYDKRIDELREERDERERALRESIEKERHLADARCTILEGRLENLRGELEKVKGTASHLQSELSWYEGKYGRRKYE